MARQILVSWIGKADLQGSSGEGNGDGPIANALSKISFDELHLLTNYPEKDSIGYAEWLGGKAPGSTIKTYQQVLSSPTNFRDIYRAADAVLSALWTNQRSPGEVTFHLSPGTPAMAAVWILLSKTTYPAALLQSSREAGVETADVPFDIAAEFIPDLLKTAEQRQVALSEARAPTTANFSDIVHRGPLMKQLISEAERAARRSLPVLIQGESGTGKELLARAIHKASTRQLRPFVAVNCGAIPAELVESEFFGHRKGAFSGSTTDRLGHFREADGGTLFLDEVGELPRVMQVKLLRALQEREVTPVGDSKPVPVDVRIIAATNRDLIAEVAKGNFREDLLYRLAVVVLHIPPVRERKGDLSPLIDAMLEHVNSMAALEPGYHAKRLSVAARNLLAKQRWPGNVREMLNTLQRASLLSDGDTIEADTISRSLLSLATPQARTDPIMNHPIETGVQLESIMADVARHYLRSALEHANGNKTAAARLLGLNSHQTLSNWLRRYQVQE